MPGTLFVVATPIGNLEDLTFRALRTLREVDLVAAEDTRRTSKLLAHYEIKKPMVSLREHNETRESPRLVERLARGESIALVSDAGTPGISDPGATLVRLCRQAGVKVVPIPGPSAVTAALSASGLSDDEFVFMGFPPSSGNAREEWFVRLAEESRTVVFFESPHRILRTLADATVVCGIRQKIVFRELSKLHEESVEWPNMDTARTSLNEQGEFVVVFGPSARVPRTDLDEASAEDMFGLMTEHVKLSEVDAAKAVSAVFGVSEARLRKALKKARIARKRSEEAAS